MPPKVQNENAYKDQIKLNLQKLKQNQIQKVKVDLTKINIKTLATKIGIVSEDVKLYMILPSSGRYYALNDRTITLLMKGKLDTNAVMGVKDEPTFSDVELSELIEQEQ